MSVYDQNLPNAYDKGLLNKEILKTFFKEFVSTTNISPFMGSSESNIFITKHKSAGQGDSTTFPLVKNIDYKAPLYGAQQILGNEQLIEVYQDSIKLEEINLGVRTQRLDMTRIKTPIDIFNLMRPQLLNAARMELTYAILRSICGNYTTNFQTTGLYNKTNAAIAGVAANGPSQARCVYGKGTAANVGTYNASVYTACNAMNAADFAVDAHTKGGLSVDHLIKLKAKAVSNTDEMAITPFVRSTKKSQGVNQYVYLMDPISYGSLRKDPEWEKYIYRGLVSSSDQPEGLSGSMYRGMIDGIYVYECPELEDFRVAGKASHNLLLGSQAVGILWGKQPNVKTLMSQDYGRDATAAIMQIRGQKPLMYPSKDDPTNAQVERGIIHSFVRHV